MKTSTVSHRRTFASLSGSTSSDAQQPRELGKGKLGLQAEGEDSRDSRHGAADLNWVMGPRGHVDGEALLAGIWSCGSVGKLDFVSALKSCYALSLTSHSLLR